MIILFVCVAIYLLITAFIVKAVIKENKVKGLSRLHILWPSLMWPVSLFVILRRLYNVWRAERALMRIARRRIEEIYPK